MSSTPTVYFIDDSATMREVIKIAFRRENINVIACHDAAMALAEIEKTRPDIVITDVIMPDKDGYDVCQYIKSHAELSKTPVVLMSGVVNRAVAERAFAVKADELLRKPFQPQDLIARVKHLLKPNATPAPSPAAAASAAAALSSIFSGVGPAVSRPAAAPIPQRPAASATALATDGGYTAAPTSFPSTPAAVAAPVPVVAAPAAPPAPAAAPVVSSPPPPAPVSAVPRSGNGHDPSKLKIEIMRLENLVKKLQSELQAEREYSRSLEAHVKALQDAGN
jgi:CheY-like chemotaxis protein